MRRCGRGIVGSSKTDLGLALQEQRRWEWWLEEGLWVNGSGVSCNSRSDQAAELGQQRRRCTKQAKQNRANGSAVDDRSAAKRPGRAVGRRRLAATEEGKEAATGRLGCVAGAGPGSSRDALGTVFRESQEDSREGTPTMAQGR